MTTTQPYKAAVAFVLTFAATLLASIEGNGNIGDMGWVDWLTVVLSAIVTAGAVYQVSNPPKAAA
jgi:hypothetical protein